MTEEEKIKLVCYFVIYGAPIFIFLIIAEQYWHIFKKFREKPRQWKQLLSGFFAQFCSDFIHDQDRKTLAENETK